MPAPLVIPKRNSAAALAAVVASERRLNRYQTLASFDATRALACVLDQLGHRSTSRHLPNRLVVDCTGGDGVHALLLPFATAAG